LAKRTKKKATKTSRTAKKPASRGTTASKKTTVKKKPAKKTAKKTVSKKAVSKKPVTKKSVTKKSAAKKKPAVKKKPPAAKKPASKKPASKKPVSKKPASKKPAAKKPTAKKPVSKKPVSKKTVSKKTVSKKPASKKAASKKPVDKKAADKKPEPKAPPASKGGPSGSAADKKSGRKGITIVSDRTKKRSRTKQPRKPFVTPGGSLLGPGVVRKPLIPSGPNAASTTTTKVADPDAPKKSPFNKRELTKFKSLLLIKRAEVFGDIEQMEADALRSSSGDLSHLPQHLADQGSDSYEQSLSLDLAAADRRLIKEIDDALARIDSRTYGVCERTGKPIRKTRLQELPWARYSIEAAREMERRGGF
jgi:DnaK suppressor protein